MYAPIFYWKEARIPIILFQYTYPRLTWTAATHYGSEYCVHYYV